MGIPSNKAGLLLAIDTNFGKLLKALQAVPESRVQELVMEVHSKSTSMSVANLCIFTTHSCTHNKFRSISGPLGKAMLGVNGVTRMSR
ncbi:hypothetical protein [Aeromonas sp. 5HA1]|uniref:hypothetical protein n=1 Tax=Aeromonas sp. 5HA1 TaxID=2699197 RepID=UPI0023DDC1F9|nr:hypothetical protein [Aeromonas sp. 5HA1]MDF2403356.1 hypothetical protein [Aeromonas sp. 5HA1]